MILPWQQADWKRVQEARRAGRLPHALLVTGAAGLGKGGFAKNLAASLLCSAPDDGGLPCGHCRGCHLFQVGTHPDYLRITQEQPGKVIPIDSIREYISRSGLTAQAGGYKVVVIEPADALNMAAANSLLKTLEEPVAWTLIMLVSSRPGQLPATIRSRCQTIKIRAPARESAAQWLVGRVGGLDAKLLLDLACGAPLHAEKLADEGVLTLRGQLLDEFAGVLAGRNDPVTVADHWSRLELDSVLSWCAGWLIDVLRLKSAPEPPGLINPDQRKRLQAIGNALEFKTLYELLDKVYEATRTLGSQLNSLMLIESVLLEVAAAGRMLKRKKR
jgi:DNA polymerase-3 subunit delta'